jgi:hypothetical protein
VRHVVYDVSHGASQIVEGRERFVTLGPKRFVVVLEPDGLPTEIVRRVFKAQQLVRPLDSLYQGLEETPALFEQLRHAERRVRIHRAGAGIPPSRRRGWPDLVTARGSSSGGDLPADVAWCEVEKQKDTGVRNSDGLLHPLDPFRFFRPKKAQSSPLGGEGRH